MMLLLVFALLLNLPCQSCPANCDSCVRQYSCSTCSSGYSLSSDGYSCFSNTSSSIIIIFSVVGSVIIIILIFCFCCRRRIINTQPSNYQTGFQLRPGQNNESRRNLSQHNNQIGATQINFILARNIQWQDIAYNGSFQHQQACVICLCKAVNVKTHCGHGFHSNCIEAWFKANPTCPTCRAQIDNIMLFCSTCYQRCKRISLRVIPKIQEHATVCNTCMPAFT